MLNARIKKLSSEAEFLIVVLVAFGLPAITSLFLMVHHMEDRTFAFTEGWARRVLLQELLTFALIALFLRLRGWKGKDLNFKVTWRDWAGGIGLTLATYVLFVVLALLFRPIWPWIENTNIRVNASALGLTSIVLLSVMNPIFEEVLAVGYIVTAIHREQNIWIAILVSALIRSIYHSYQGPFAVLSVLCMGILFAYVYHRWNRLWPLIVAHALLDAIGLLASRGL